MLSFVYCTVFGYVSLLFLDELNIYTYKCMCVSYRLLQNIEYGSLCYTVSPCWLFVLYIAVSISVQLLSRV